MDLVEQTLKAVEESSGAEELRNEMIDHGANIERLGKLLLSKAAPEDHAAITAAIAELKDRVTALIETANLFAPLVKGIRIEWEKLQEAKWRFEAGE